MAGKAISFVNPGGLIAMAEQARRTVEDKRTRAATVLATEELTSGRQVAGRRARDAAAAAAAVLKQGVPASAAIWISRQSPRVIAGLYAALGQDASATSAQMDEATGARQDEPDPDEAEVLALLDSFDGRTKEIEQRIDRVLARMGVS